MARKKKEELKGAQNVAVEEKTASQQTEKAAEVKTNKKTSAKKGSKKSEGKSKRAQTDFENKRVSTFTDLGLYFGSDPLEEEADEDRDWEEITSVSIGDCTISLCMGRGRDPLYVVTATYYSDEDYVVLGPKFQDMDQYPGYSTTGYCTSRLDVQNFYEFCILDWEANKLRDVRPCY